MRTRELVDLSHLGFCHFAGEHTTNALSTRMDVEHDLSRPLAIESEECFQHDDDEIHRGEVVIEQDYLIQRRPHDLRARFLDRKAMAGFRVLVGFSGHEEKDRWMPRRLYPCAAQVLARHAVGIRACKGLRARLLNFVA